MEDEFNEDDHKQSDMGYFAIIPTHLISDRRLTLFDIVLYGVISSLTKRHGHCWASNRYLAQIMDSSIRHIPRSISRLKSARYIKTILGKDEKRLMFINFDSDSPSPKGSMGDVTPDMGGCSNGHGGMTEPSCHISYSKVDNKEDTLKLAPQPENPVLYLNEKTGKNFDPKNKSTQRLLSARRAEGRTYADFVTVIDRKVKTWLNDPKMTNYLRPSTLFRESNFESYINEKEAVSDLPESLRHLDP